jgi:hypothetical protein
MNENNETRSSKRSRDVHGREPIRTLLHDHNGTDVTMDILKEEEFDASQLPNFLQRGPEAIPPQLYFMLKKALGLNEPLTYRGKPVDESIYHPEPHYIIISEEDQRNLSVEDLNRIKNVTAGNFKLVTSENDIPVDKRQHSKQRPFQLAEHLDFVQHRYGGI